MRKNHVILFVLIAVFFMPRVLWAEGYPAIPEFQKDDKVLILAPHPDDETIAAAGVIQRAIKAGSEVKVVCFTNGDNNELAFIFYEKRLTFKKKEFIHMGEVRRKETVDAMVSLGVDKKNIIFLGYPDFGTMEVFTKYWQNVRPFRSMLTKVSKVPYPDAFSPNAPYIGESVLRDLEKIILPFGPTKIFVSHPVDTNRDHRALYLFSQVALWDLENLIKRPQVFAYLIHVVGWPKPRGAHSDLTLLPPDNMVNNEMSWQAFKLSKDEIETKDRAVKCYKSQIPFAPSYLFTFVRQNELFGGFLPVVLKKQNTGEEIHWQDLKISLQEVVEDSKGKGRKIKNPISSVAYACQDGSLYIKLNLKKKISSKLGVSIFLIGFNKKVPFAKMPKIHLAINLLGLHIKDKKQTLFIKSARLKYEKGMAIINIPLTVLGAPDYILSCVKARFSDLSPEEAGWRILEMEQ